MKLLNEAYSDSLPQWLKAGFNKDSRVKSYLMHQHFDLSRCKYVEWDIPLDVSEITKIKKFGTPIMLIEYKDSQRVYIPGMDYIGSFGFWSHFTSANGKIAAYKLLPYIKAFGYLENIDDNYNVNLKRERSLNKQGAEERGEGQYLDTSKHWDYEKRDYVDVEPRWVVARGEDKSGYKPVKSPLDLLKKLDKINLSNYSAKIENYYNKLNLLRKELKDTFSEINNRSWDAISNMDLKSKDAIKINFFQDYYYIMNAYKEAVKYYRSWVEDVNEIVNDPKIDDEEKSIRLDDDRDYGDYTYLRRRVQEVKDSLKRFKQEYELKDGENLTTKD